MRGFTDSVRGSIHYPQSIALRHLTVSFLDRFEQAPPGWRSCWPQVNFEVPVTVLRICGNCKLYQDDTLKHFRSFLATFPAVRKLVIEHCSFSAAMETATAPDFVRPLDTATLAMRIPHLAAFVVFLETTSVLEFRYIGELDEYTVRWRRHSRSDPLVRDAVL
ncbi:uncharacterized protein JCM10292_004480 [Rhodotorula paludigena]|uniref:uncharacterized protein n=1 Tax=Rhodotorula paludigena TaxID=86838 RepID=UPI003170EB2B